MKVFTEHILYIRHCLWAVQGAKMNKIKFGSLGSLQKTKERKL